MGLRLHALDSLRGLAALAIVVWHWQHFFAVSGEWPDEWQRSAEPLYWFLKPLYDEGWAAVDLFFPLSGFIFFWLYGGKVREGRVGAWRFARLRFSRLYPLHVVMLVAVAIMQYFFFRATGHFFIYDANDLAHFASGLVMAQQWLPPTLEQSFNGPAWSVSVEVLLYGLFFAACRLGVRGFWMAFGIALSGIALMHWNAFIARGVMGFFLGGAVHALDQAILKRADAKRIARMVGYAALALWIVVVVEAYLHPLHALFPPQPNDELFLLMFIFSVSPVTILALALREQVLGASWERFSFLGDISYSTYMLHFPMQLALALVAAHFALTPAFFENWIALVAFYVVLIGLGALTFRRFERPMQDRLRDARGSAASP
jgi:peptidoglycan/LPS O-acetylase OafA/YrhL